jgi:hypothetical protein
MRFRDKRELTAYLKSYEAYYWDARDILCNCCPGSPMISDTPRILNHMSKIEQYNRDIEQYDYDIDKMDEIRELIEELRNIDAWYYIIVLKKYTSFMKLESIAGLIGKSPSYTQKTYNKALTALFNIANDLV